MKRNTVIRTIITIVVIVVLISTFSYFTDRDRGTVRVPTSLVLQQIQDNNVEEAQFDDKTQELRLTLKEARDGTEGSVKIVTQYPASVTADLFKRLQDSDATTVDTQITQESIWPSMLLWLGFLILLMGGFMFLSMRMQGGRGGMMGFGRSRAKQLTKDMPQTTFADVAGADEAVAELAEIRDFLQHPGRYEALGASIPKGVLLYGPPGTGKTLIARAVAGEAGVPFFSISGSDFVEMFVGVGASRVRDLFEQAKKSAPSIIFVDEIDAVGRQRGTGMGGGHDEREQTLNQMLVEMDGFGDRDGVIVIAATNRPDILDPALLRPGRFDRQIPVTNPDLAGRRAILRVHAQGKPLGPDADLDALAKRTAGMSGADLENLINEAALLTARVNGNIITADALEEASDRVMGGPRRTSKIISEEEKKITAYHESGHTLAAWAMPDIDPVYKVTILPRGRTGGFAMVAGDDDKGLQNRAELLARIVFAMGGRAAEELVFHEPTTGASSDIENATKIARAMVTEYGMSAALGAVKYGEEQGDPFVGRGAGQQSGYSAEVARQIDAEVRKLIEAAHTEAWAILTHYRDALDALAAELLEKETLRRPDLERILGDVAKRERITTFNEFGERVPSSKPPVKTPAELAKERGEEWPSRQREEEVRAAFGGPVRRGADASREDATAEVPVVGAVVPTAVPGYGPTAAQPPVPTYGGPTQASPGVPAHGQAPAGDRVYGSPPPPGWSAPGWPPAAGQGQASGQPHPQGGPGGQAPYGGAGNYGAGQYGAGNYGAGHYGAGPAAGGGGTGSAGNPQWTGPVSPQAWSQAGGPQLGQAQAGQAQAGQAQVGQAQSAPQELRGFRLPEHERSSQAPEEPAPQPRQNYDGQSTAEIAIADSAANQTAAAEPTTRPPQSPVSPEQPPRSGQTPPPEQPKSEDS